LEGPTTVPYYNYVAWVLTGDVNHDHHQDLTIVEWPQDNVRVVALLGDGTGAFSAAAPTFLESALDNYFNGAALADFDGDGNLDVVGWTIGSVMVAFGNGTGGFGAIATTSMAGQNFVPCFVAGDFNSDGKTDLMGTLTDLSNTNDVHIDALISQGRAFAAPQELRTGIVNSASLPLRGSAFASTDLDGDGTPDVVLVSEAPSGSWNLQAILMNVLQ
jgi:hypothetical protein